MLRAWLPCFLAIAATPAVAQETFDYDRRWYRYYFLGYDVEPSCTEADYRQ